MSSSHHYRHTHTQTHTHTHTNTHTHTHTHTHAHPLLAHPPHYGINVETLSNRETPTETKRHETDGSLPEYSLLKEAHQTAKHFANFHLPKSWKFVVNTYPKQHVSH
jgi:hypothetical protein